MGDPFIGSFEGIEGNGNGKLGNGEKVCIATES